MKQYLSFRTLVLAGNFIMLFVIGFQYMHGSVTNDFPLLTKLFQQSTTQMCTSSGCWLSVVPFLGAAYWSVALLSLFAIVFRPGKELSLTLVAIASFHLIMVVIRLFFAPDIYVEIEFFKASVIQMTFGVCLLVCAIPKKRQV